MPNHSQANRPMRVDTVLGEDVLLLEGFNGGESVSQPFAFTLDLLSTDHSIHGERLLRSPATVTLNLSGGTKRVIHGQINRFVQLDRTGELTVYRAELVPWLWFLSLSSECKIFQNLSVLEIVEQVFKAQGYSDFDIHCRRSNP